ncbi:MAG: hypothetical protein JXA33_16270 [Anaerolineae bacterium]|nr:hypothetical protein [Anaerolineae bacterium]
MQQICVFATHEVPDLNAAGGKGLSLIKMTHHGLPVPPGFVLTTEFFTPWLVTIHEMPEWRQVQAALTGEFPDLKFRCDTLKTRCADLTMDTGRADALAQAVNELGGALFAVRSSSPEEDLEGASFAGGYETVLGVTPVGIQGAIKRAFASCLDARVFVYKREHGFDVSQPRIAVVVQRQIAATTAGVAFSLNPLNNDYDEAVINANFGLGESVVSGQVSPDTFVVDKVKRAILEKKIGKKEISVWAQGTGGTLESPAGDRDQLCLSDAQVLRLVDLVMQVERIYGQPMDIEWAFGSLSQPRSHEGGGTGEGALRGVDQSRVSQPLSYEEQNAEIGVSPTTVISTIPSLGRREVGEEVFLLQARPITTYFPLPEPLRTAPGEPRRLYWDMTLTKWGMSEPLSVMGTDYIAITNTIMLALSMGISSPDALEVTRPTLDGRVYVNASNSFKMQGKKRVAAEFRTMDTTAAAILENLDEKAYLPDKLPPALRGIRFKVIRSMLRPVFAGLKALQRPEVYAQRYLESVEALRADLKAMAASPLPLKQLAEQTLSRMVRDLDLFIPVIFAAEIARMRLRRMFKKDVVDADIADASLRVETRDRLAGLDRALPHNITIEMGLEMVRLAHFPEITMCESEAAFLDGLRAGTFSSEFTEAWTRFMSRYGMRCPMEMDPATPRPSEQPGKLFTQLRALALHPDQDPQVLYQRGLTERERAYTDLLVVARQRGKARQFEKQYRIVVSLAGFRETPKYCMILAVEIFRQRALQIGQTWVEAGRLDTATQIFDLHIDDVARALADPALDLRSLTDANTRYLRRYAHSREFPRIVDSRGRILRAPRKAAQEGELTGEAISPGVVQGPVKVLHTPDEKPVLPGDILVARATDPGWTPLFINAAGVVLEVGGLLQHGALVAREYGKPCVAGIEGVTVLLQDEQIVELDGANGVVRIMDLENI